MKISPTAAHESGHTVAAIATGMRVNSVTIVPQGNVAGSCDMVREEFANLPKVFWDDLAAINAKYPVERRSRVALSEAEIEKHLLRMMAGPVAEEVHTGYRINERASDDYRQAKEILLAADYSNTAIIFALAQARVYARAFLTKRWAQVQLVACALEMERTLNGEQVRALLTHAA